MNGASQHLPNSSNADDKQININKQKHNFFFTEEFKYGRKKIIESNY